MSDTKPTPADLLRKQADLDALKAWDEERSRGYREEITKLRRTVERNKTKYGMLVDAVAEATREPILIQVPPLPEADRRRKPEVREALLHLTDTHLGKRTASYSMEVGRERILLAGKKAIRFTKDQRASYKIQRCRLYLGGDLVEGEVGTFPRQPHEIDAPIIDQAVRRGPAVFVELIVMLLQEFREVDVISVPGNHGQTARDGSRLSNWDTVVAEWIRQGIHGLDFSPNTEARQRVKFIIAEEFYAIDDLPGGWRVVLVHGDEMRSFAGYPWYAVGRSEQSWYQSLTPHDYLFMGHHHVSAMAAINYSEFRACPSTETGNIYALARFKSAGYPGAWLGYASAEHGIVQEHRLYLTKPGERRPAMYRFGGEPREAA